MQIDKDHLRNLRVLHTLLEHYKLFSEQLEAQFREMVQQYTGVDLGSGDFHLDLEKGTIERASD